ncbi:methylated-DNA--[protein]-cysteine S-methyltransferase [Lentibacillus sp. L22]|uniref:methylated-DNA--[protein]-cysteine S-methyltransferase n=1 Tax=Lentibacillus sp. L22 TaxID=3163028 RepID=UPI003466C016
MKSEQKQAVYYGEMNDKNGTIYVAATDKGLCYVGSLNEGINELKNWIDKKRSGATLIENVEKIRPYMVQLEEYLKGKRKNFDIPIDVKGTPFQEMIWNELQRIPYGETASYSDIANNIGTPTAARAVGTAIGANPVLIVVPCHRVVAKNGNLTGFRGGLPMKEKLLILENPKKKF